jgi:3-hydroxyacyl-[acyl-carrier-protein] dehydratase
VSPASSPASDLQAALRFLPHGPEFRFIDHLVSLVPGVEGAGQYTVRGDEPFLKGHFPGQPMMPGVLLVEAVAQLAGTVAQSDPQRTPLPGVKLTAVRGAKILGTALPGDTIAFTARITGRMDHLVQAQGTAKVREQLILQVEVTLSGEK